MRPTALGSVVMTFRQEPLVRMYDRKSVVVLATPGYDITTDHHLFDTLSSLNLTEKAIVEDALSTLGFDFGVLIISEEQVFLGCGPRSFIKLFFQVTDSSLLVRDHLPQGLGPPKRADTLNTEAIISFFGSSMAVGAFEIRRTTACIDRHWRCVPNSQAVIVDAKNRTFSGYPFDNIWNLFHNDDIGARDAIERARSKLEGFITRSSRLGGVCVEASGGIDSGIVMATAKNNPNSSFRCGISCEYPFFEFAREIRFRRDLYNHLNAKAHYETFSNTIPFARCDLVPGHDTPSVGSTNWSLYNATCSSASLQGASILLTGHGGDRLFLENPFKKPSPFRLKTVDRPTWFPRHLYEASIEEARDVHAHLYSATANGVCGEWNGAMFEAGWSERYGSIGTGLTRYCPGYLDRDFIRAMAHVWLAARKLDNRVQKPIAHLVFPESLPESIWRRPSKVNHLGIIYRGARIWKRQLLSVAHRASPVLDAMGISAKRLLRVLQDVGDGRDCANPFIALVISVILWAAPDMNFVDRPGGSNEIEVDMSGDAFTLSIDTKSV